MRLDTKVQDEDGKKKLDHTKLIYMVSLSKDSSFNVTAQ